ncbi:MAG: DUF4296 domain-containing protein [Bergeyella zoohelcum]|nr:DUF4296 domain-containing protein [Bergeyella zoohelcum]
MRAFLILMLSVSVLFSCENSKSVNTPKNLIDKDKMSELIAEFAINEQMSIINHKGNMETNTRYILKKYGVSAAQFSESYAYYLASPSDLEKILDNAQNIVIEKHPEAETYIEKKEKETNQGQ